MSDNLELTAAITTEEPEIAADLDELRYLVFRGMKGDTGDSAKSAYLDYDVVRLIEDDSIYTSATMWSDIDNGVVPLIYYISAENVHVYFELDYGDFTGATPIIYFRSKTHLLSVDSTGHFTLTDRPQGGGSADAVLYTPQTLTDAQKAQARENIGAVGAGEGGGMIEAVKQALLDCFENVAWINDDGQDYYDALYAALYPPVDVLSISAVFTQGEAVIYVTDSLDTLKQYLVVTATMTDSTTQTVTNYTLSGTLTEGTSTITVLYGGKSDTFNVVVSRSFWDYEWDYTQGKLEDQDGWGIDTSDGSSSELVTGAERITVTGSLASYFQIYPSAGATFRTMTNGYGIMEVVFVGQLNMSSTVSDGIRITAAESSSNRIGINTVTGKFRIRDNSDRTSGTAIADYQNGTEYTVRLVMKGTKVDIYINGDIVAENTTPISQGGSSNSILAGYLGNGYYVDLKSVKLRIGSIS